MCGIAGYWKPGRSSAKAGEALEQMLQTIGHRGPDGQGFHVDARRGLGMGHARLSIIDLETGAQPLSSADGSVVLTVNGEFYDYKRIRAGLVCRGETFRSKSDSEIAIPLYRRKGLEFVHDLRGEFAFALFDAHSERLLLVRDRFGIKPLYYRLTDDSLYYGSEVKAVLAHPDVPRSLSRESALHQMMQVMVPGSTAFEGVRALLPGHVLVVERSPDGSLSARELQYWDFTFPEKEDHDGERDAEYYIEGVRSLLLDSIATRLEADVPVGCYLSGGIDSCSILGLATSLQQSTVKAFTISFDHDAYDESSVARQMAESTGADQEVLSLRAKDLYGESFKTVTHHTERTFYNTLAVAKWHMSRRVRECGLKVVITGEGSDELFGGYPFFKREMALRAPTGRGGHEEPAGSVFDGALLAEAPQSHPVWNDVCGFTPSWIQPWMLVLEHARSLLADEAAEQLRTYDPLAEIARAIDPDKVRGRHPLDIAQYTWSKTMLEGQILTWGGDRVDMANSMESRPAFLDHNLAEFATRIPPEMRIRNGVEKWVLREAMKEVLPEVLYKREKFAFMAPPSQTDPAKAQGLRQLSQNWLNPECVKAVGLFDPGRVEKLLSRANDHAASDAILSRRTDILLNHLIQIHLLALDGLAPRRVQSRSGEHGAAAGLR